MKQGINTDCFCENIMEHMVNICYCCSICNVFLTHACCRVQPTAAKEGSRIFFPLRSAESAVCVL